MLSCALKGPSNINYGLGNQLFQIATILSLAKDNNDVATFPMLSEDFFGGYDKNLLRKVNADPSGLKLEIAVHENLFSYNKLDYEENCVYVGYFQSEKYFVHNRDYILDMFSFPEEVQKLVEETYGDLLKGQTTAVHVRRGDYINLQDHHPLLTHEYYNKALGLFSASDHLLVFSDDVEWCRENLNFSNAVFIEGQSDVADLLLMSLCDNHIIANSSFSWWGAWLSRSENKKVVAPKNWFGPAKDLDDSDLIPETWIRL